MTFSALVAEPNNEDWDAIAKGIRRFRSEAAILRVKDAEQAVRFLFERGLCSDEPETPDVLVLSAQLPIGTSEAIIALIRRHARTEALPVIVVWRGEDPERIELRGLQTRPPVKLVGGGNLEQEVSAALPELCRPPMHIR